MLSSFYISEKGNNGESRGNKGDNWGQDDISHEAKNSDSLHPYTGVPTSIRFPSGS